jgi:hypothetical protein
VFAVEYRAWAREEREEPVKEDDSNEMEASQELETENATHASGDGTASEGDVEREKARRRVRKMERG